MATWLAGVAHDPDTGIANPICTVGEYATLCSELRRYGADSPSGPPHGRWTATMPFTSARTSIFPATRAIVSAWLRDFAAATPPGPPSGCWRSSRPEPTRRGRAPAARRGPPSGCWPSLRRPGRRPRRRRPPRAIRPVGRRPHDHHVVVRRAARRVDRRRGAGGLLPRPPRSGRVLTVRPDVCLRQRGGGADHARGGRDDGGSVRVAGRPAAGQPLCGPSGDGGARLRGGGGPPLY